MASPRKIIIAVLIALIVLVSGIVYYHDYVKEHSQPYIGIDVSVKPLNNGSVAFYISAIINSTNFLTKFTFPETQYIEGIHVVYAGPNITDAKDRSSGVIPPGMSNIDLSGIVHFYLSNEHPKTVAYWNETVYNSTPPPFMPAPNGYYIMYAIMVVGAGYGIPHLFLPSDFILVDNGTVSLVSSARQ
ncbi:hypothetical protein [Thermoplasma sp.]|uniref:hypothetical protein n=1 Tax=Thermoplasma sp. TaxID=1973142 RepID=UPI002615B818|nr:hypothetical protein [Thermoplasma sp.]